MLSKVSVAAMALGLMATNLSNNLKTRITVAMGSPNPASAKSRCDSTWCRPFLSKVILHSWTASNHIWHLVKCATEELFMKTCAIRDYVAAIVIAALFTAFSAPSSAAEITATTASISGKSAVLIPCSQTPTTLPDIVIAENYVGAIHPHALLAIGADYKQFTAFDLSTTTLKAYRQDTGADVSATIIGSNQLANDPVPSASNIPDITFQLASASSSVTGPIKLVISGMKVLGNDSNAGDVYLKIGGAESSGTVLDSLSKIDSNMGGRATAQMLLVGSEVSVSFPSLSVNTNFCSNDPPPPPVANGPLTSRTLTLPTTRLPSYAQDRTGSIFVIALIPQGDKQIILLLDNAQRWSGFTDCQSAPAYYAGQLKEMASVPVVSTPSDLSALLGTQIVRGFGIAPDGMPAGTACADMLSNARYTVEYTLN